MTEAKPIIFNQAGDQDTGTAVARRIAGALADVNAESQTGSVVGLLAADGPKASAIVTSAQPDLETLAAASGHLARIVPVKCSPSLFRSSALRRRPIRNTDLILLQPLADATAESVFNLALGIAELRAGRLTVALEPGLADAWRPILERADTSGIDVSVSSAGADDVAARLVTEPAAFDLIVCSGYAGRIIEAEAVALTGTPSLVPVGFAGSEAAPPIFAPLHPHPAGVPAPMANPLASILALAMALRYGAGRPDLAEITEYAAEHTLELELRSPDLIVGGPNERRAGTEEFALTAINAVTALLAQLQLATAPEDAAPDDGSEDPGQAGPGPAESSGDQVAERPRDDDEPER